MRSKIGFEFALTAILLTTGFAMARLEAQTLQLPAAPPGGLNASKLPDAEGIHLGMTVAQAMAVMKSLFPGATGVLPRYSKYANGPSWVSSITGTSADGHVLRVNQVGRCASFKVAKDHAASGSCR